MLFWLQQSGNKPITLMGGGTTMVGDPSGKDESRAMRSLAEIEVNKASIRGVFAKVLRYGSGASDAVMLDNAEWLTKLNWIEMLRDIGRHFSVNRMLSFDSVKTRLERQQELSFLEFNYMILQAYDFVELNKSTGCVLQMGGADHGSKHGDGSERGRQRAGEPPFAPTSPARTPPHAPLTRRGRCRRRSRVAEMLHHRSGASVGPRHWPSSISVAASRDGNFTASPYVLAFSGLEALPASARL